jgi:serine/threonine protein kinase
VAVKRVHRILMEMDGESSAEFQREVSTMRQLRHQNVVLFFGAGRMNEQAFLITEYMARGSLRSVLAGSAPLTWALRIHFASDMAAGLAYLHENMSFHRDIKSSNLLVTDRWVVKIGDFGTSRLCWLCKASVGGSGGSSFAGAMSGIQLPDAESQVLGYGDGDRSMTIGAGTLLWSAPEVLTGSSCKYEAVVAAVVLGGVGFRRGWWTPAFPRAHPSR